MAFVESTVRGFAQALSRSLGAEELAGKRGLLQAMDPRVRLVGVLSLVLVVTLARKLAAVGVLFLLAVLLAFASRVRFSLLLKRVWLVVLGFTGVMAVPALFVTPGTVAARLGRFAVTQQGLNTAGLLIARVETAVTFTTALILCTPWTHLLKALRALWVPAEVVTILAMTHRYIFLLIESASQMFESRQSRIFGYLSGGEQRRLAARTAGVLLSKSIDLSGEVYLAMQSRGFDGEVRLLDEFRMRPRDYAALGCFLLAAGTMIWAGR
jgi:cobalt ECF transporter T component CbiQ